MLSRECSSSERYARMAFGDGELVYPFTFGKGRMIFEIAISFQLRQTQGTIDVGMDCRRQEGASHATAIKRSQATSNLTLHDNLLMHQL